MNPPRIDFAEIAARSNLRTLIESDLGPPNRSRKWLCPFHADSNPSLGLTPDGKHWKCWACNAGGDALDWIRQQEGLSVVDAAKRLDPTLGEPSGRPTVKPARIAPPKPSPTWQSESWQGAAAEIVARAEAMLWSTDGWEALQWLRGRGLDDATIARFRLGFNPEEGWTSARASFRDGRVGSLHFERGITIPWCAPRACYGKSGELNFPRWCGVNVRRLLADVNEPWPGGDKYKALAGSERGHFYPWPDLLPTQPTLPALVCEGEIDALIGVQEAGWIAHVGTIGGATQGPQRSALAALALCPRWLIATDNDVAGIEAAWAWRERSPEKSRRALPPRGNDLGEFHQAGGDVVAWLRSEIERHTRSPRP